MKISNENTAGVVFMAFGPSYSYSLIRLLYGKKWSDGEASTVLHGMPIFRDVWKAWKKGLTFAGEK
jgi:hypothetical protein